MQCGRRLGEGLCIHTGPPALAPLSPATNAQETPGTQAQPAAVPAGTRGAGYAGAWITRDNRTRRTVPWGIFRWVSGTHCLPGARGTRGQVLRL